MIGWVVLRGKVNIHPVLCWHRDSITARRSVFTMTGFMWPKHAVTPLDTEAEVAALLLQGHKLVVAAPGKAAYSVNWIRGNQR